MATRNILAVDDNVAGRRLCEFALRQAGWRILTAENGEEALQLLGRHRVDPVVSDIHMIRPAMIEALKRDRPGKLQKSLKNSIVSPFSA